MANVKKMIKDFITEDILLLTLVIYLTLVLNDLRVVIESDDWLTATLWIDFLKSCASNLVVLIGGLFSKVVKRIVGSDRDAIQRNSKIVGEAYLQLQNQALMSTDPIIKEAAKNLSLEMIQRGCNLFDIVTREDNTEDNSILNPDKQE